MIGRAGYDSQTEQGDGHVEAFTEHGDKILVVAKLDGKVKGGKKEHSTGADVCEEYPAECFV